MKHRKLRIVWSVAWGIVAVLLVPLWVRSYWWCDNIGVGSLAVSSSRSVVQFSYASPITGTGGWGWYGFPIHEGITHLPPFEWRSDGTLSYLNLPIWILLLMASTISVGAWLRWSKRFNTRTLLLVVTIVALLTAVIGYSINRQQQPPALYPASPQSNYYQPVQ